MPLRARRLYSSLYSVADCARLARGSLGGRGRSTTLVGASSVGVTGTGRWIFSVMISIARSCLGFLRGSLPTRSPGTRVGLGGIGAAGISCCCCSAAGATVGLGGRGA